MAGYGVGELYLYGVVVGIFAYLLVTLYLTAYVEVILLDLIEQAAALLVRERG